MARLIGAAQRILIHGLRRPSISLESRNAISAILFQARTSASEPIAMSPFKANILRVLRNELEYQCEYAPPQQPVTKFNSFTVEDRPGEQWIRMRGRFGDAESIKMEATMFDGYVSVPKLGDDSSGVDTRLHLSLLVDISKDDGGDELEFLCSAWSGFIEVQKVYMLRRDQMLGRPYMGPDFRKLDAKIQKALKEYLEERGVNDELSVFLHEYMMNKDRTELIKWLADVKDFMEK